MKLKSKIWGIFANGTAVRPEQAALLFIKSEEFSAVSDSLNFTEESVRWMDNLITDSLGVPPTDFEGLTLFYGVYLGEVIRRQFGWQWKQANNGSWHMVGPKKEYELLAFPFEKAWKRLVNGTDDSLVVYLNVLKGLTYGTAKVT